MCFIRMLARARSRNGPNGSFRARRGPISRRLSAGTPIAVVPLSGYGWAVPSQDPASEPLDRRFRLFIPVLVAVAILGLCAALATLLLGNWSGIPVLFSSVGCLWAARYLRRGTETV